MQTIKTYEQAKRYLGNKKERPYAHNTRILMDSLNMGHNVITVTYHGNAIVDMFPDGTTSYNSCGWKTLTTKERINWFLPEGFTLWQEKSVWYIGKHWGEKRYTFADGLAIKNGEVYNYAPENEQDVIKAKIKAIKKFVNGYVSALLSGEVESPSGGDCWYCLMVTTDGKNLGDATGNSDHIEFHIEESYFVPSLLVNAAKFKGMSILAKDGIARLWQGETISAWQKDVLTRDVKSSLTAYLKHELGIAQ
jgi:hypothetical protein